MNCFIRELVKSLLTCDIKTKNLQRLYKKYGVMSKLLDYIDEKLVNKRPSRRYLY